MESEKVSAVEEILYSSTFLHAHSLHTSKLGYVATNFNFFNDI